MTHNQETTQNNKGKSEPSDGHGQRSSCVETVPCSSKLSDEFSFGRVFEVSEEEVGENGEMGEDA